jgi:alpha-tubulin suppressor-like RCC1 family protein
MLAAILAGCSSPTSNPITPPPPPPAVATVTLTPATVTLEIGGTQALTAAVRDASNAVLTGRSVTWQTGNAAVATVSGSGVVTAVAAGGPVTITATSEGRSGTAQVTVSAPLPAPVNTVALTGGGASIGVGATTTFTATLRDAANSILTGRAVVWATSNAAVATVSQAGVVTGVTAGGPVTITATSEGKSGTAQVTVTAPAVTLTTDTFGAESYHTCQLFQGTGTIVFCSGEGQFGQLGRNAVVATQLTPLQLVGAWSFAKVYVGNFYTCGLTAAGAAWCWGRGAQGVLGNGGTTDQLAPVAVSGGKTFSRMFLGWGGAACALEPSGAAWCWGQAGSGELGNGGSGNQSTPVAAAAGMTFASLAMTAFTTCGLTAAGVAWCWGSNIVGTIGNGATGGNVVVPAQVTGGHLFVEIIGGDQSFCGRKADGTVFCWGLNDGGQVGDGTTTSRSAPVAVATAQRFVRLGGGRGGVCGLTAAGAAWCWGAFMGNATTPQLVPGGRAFSEIDVGGEHACGRQGADIYCWGRNNSGQLGNGTTTDSAIPVRATIST